MEKCPSVVSSELEQSLITPKCPQRVCCLVLTCFAKQAARTVIWFDGCLVRKKAKVIFLERKLQKDKEDGCPEQQFTKVSMTQKALKPFAFFLLR